MILCTYVSMLDHHKEKRSASNREVPSTAYENLDEKFHCGDFVAVYLEK